MNQPIFVEWKDRERDDEVVALANHRQRAISDRTWRRWRHHAKHGKVIYQDLVADLNLRVRNAWVRSQAPPISPKPTEGKDQK